MTSHSGNSDDQDRRYIYYDKQRASRYVLQLNKFTSNSGNSDEQHRRNFYCDKEKASWNFLQLNKFKSHSKTNTVVLSNMTNKKQVETSYN